MHTLPFHARRRRLLSSAAAGLLLSACGGGSADDEDVVELSADREQAYVGDRVALSARFRHGTARIEPGLGPVRSGQTVRTPPLDRDTSFDLVVTSDAGTRRRTLTMPVRFRDRYAPAATPLAASLFALAVLPDGRVLVIGGSRGIGVASDAVDVYEPDAQRLRRLATLASGRSEHRATVLDDGRVLVTGGLAALGGSQGSELIDPALGQATPSGPMSVPRVHHAALRLADGRVLVTGGSAAGEGSARPVSDSAELWDPATGRFRRLSSRMAMARSGHTMTLLPDGRVLVAGGYSDREPYLALECFDPSTERFEVLPAAAGLRAHHAAHLDAQGRVLLLGGETVDAAGRIVALAEVLRVDATARRVERMPALAQPRSLAATVSLPSGDVLLFGGETSPRQAVASAERYDLATGSRPLAPLDAGRTWHAAARLPSGRVLVLGGEGGDGAYRDRVLVYE